MPTIFTEHFLTSVSWTLVHSLWQGVAAALLSAVIIVFTRKTSAAVRYGLLCTVFFLFIIGTIVSFLWEWKVSSATTFAISSWNVGSVRLFDGQWMTQIDLFLQNNSRWVVSCWIIILLFRFVKLLLDFMYVKRLRNNCNKSAGSYWTTKIEELAIKTGIKKHVSLLESTLVKVPMIIGHFKPVILVPAGIIAHLQAKELEAVLLHELAHIRRHDYLVNVMQRVTEMVFFFNPGLLWVSALLRTERENCCDDMAIRHTENKIQFVEALIGCKEYSLQAPAYAMGLFGAKNVLLKRITRIASGDNRTLCTSETTFFVLNILTAVLLFFYLGNLKEKSVHSLIRDNRQSSIIRYVGPASQFEKVQEFSPVSQVTPLKTEKQKTRQTIQKTSTVSTISISSENDQKISEAYEHKTIAEVGEVTYEQARSTAEHDREQAVKDREQAMKDREQAMKDRAQAELDRIQAAKDREVAIKDRQQADRDRMNNPAIHN